jgi:hypothetical protein
LARRGFKFASSALMLPITQRFIAKIEQFVREQRVPLVCFEKRQRKGEVMKEHLAKFTGTEGVLFVGKAQEKTPVFQTQRRRDPKTGQAFPWIVRSTAMVVRTCSAMRRGGSRRITVRQRSRTWWRRPTNITKSRESPTRTVLRVISAEATRR